MGVLVEVVDGCRAARWAPDLESDRLGVELVEDLARRAATERTFVNAEDTVQPVDDESGQRDDSQDREHEPEAGEQAGKAAPFGRPAYGLLVVAARGSLGRQRLRPRLGGR